MVGTQRLHPALTQGCWKEGTQIYQHGWEASHTETHTYETQVCTTGRGSAPQDLQRRGLEECVVDSCACQITTRFFSLYSFSPVKRLCTGLNNKLITWTQISAGFTSSSWSCEHEHEFVIQLLLLEKNVMPWQKQNIMQNIILISNNQFTSDSVINLKCHTDASICSLWLFSLIKNNLIFCFWLIHCIPCVNCV